MFDEFNEIGDDEIEDLWSRELNVYDAAVSRELAARWFLHEHQQNLIFEAQTEALGYLWSGHKFH